MSKTAIIYWSGTGNTEAMAVAIAQGAKAADPDAALFSISEISAADALAYDTLILGCPSMGSEVLEETEFEPFFTELESSLAGKNVALFGSYGWGDGAWMRDWEQRVIVAGGKLVDTDGLIINDAPDDDGLEACRQLGQKAAAL